MKTLPSHARFLVFSLALFQLSWFVNINLKEATASVLFPMSSCGSECDDTSSTITSNETDACDTTPPSQSDEQLLPLPPSRQNDSTIRRWGCNLQEAPFIFVHIGKAGGGGVRARLAASALDYKRPNWFRVHKDLTYYYPIWDDSQTLHKGHFASSTLPNMVPTGNGDAVDAFKGDYQWEGVTPCGATTPLGQAIACPLVSTQCRDERTRYDNNTQDGSRCDLVYMGHNLLGSEFHWLPTDFLLKWWRTRSSIAQPCHPHHPMTARIAELLQDRHQVMNGTLEVIPVDGDKTYTPRMASPSVQLQCAIPPSPFHVNFTDKIYRQYYKDNYETCFQPKEDAVDTLVQQLASTPAISDINDPGLVGARMISSLPVVRVTVLRDPFSWLLSKFFWHHEHPHIAINNATTNATASNASSSSTLQWVSPDRGTQRNKEQYVHRKRAGKPPPPEPFVPCDDINYAANGWATLRATSYILYLCGQHCLGAYAKTISTSDSKDLTTILQQLLPNWERQASHNLRHSFAVVGLLNETNQFYEMVTQRVAYMNTSLNPQVTGKQHSSNNGNQEAKRCRERYASQEFQDELSLASPAVAALQRLYKIAVTVNRFQQEELNQCS